MDENKVKFHKKNLEIVVYANKMKNNMHILLQILFPQNLKKNNMEIIFANKISNMEIGNMEIVISAQKIVKK